MTIVTLGPAKVDLVGIRAGDRNTIAIIILADGLPFDLTGMVVTAQARKTANDAIALDADVTITDAVAGAITLVWEGDAVADIIGSANSWRGVWDLQLDNSGSILTICAGSFSADMDVTRP